MSSGAFLTALYMGSRVILGTPMPGHNFANPSDGLRI